MGLQIRTYVDGNQKFIELYGNEEIDMEVSFAEIQDITKKNSAFTKEFKVPGSKNNNYIFNYFFDINQVFTDWNPKKKFEADLIYDGYEIYNGYVRLNSVSINKIEKVYSITFYSAVGDLVANIGDKALCNVDTTSLNHSLYDLNVAQSLFFDTSLHNPYSYNLANPTSPTTITPINTGKVQYILGQRGYDYTGSTFGDIRDINVANTPLLDFSGITGFFDFSGTPVISSYLIPSVRTRTLYELIVNQAGYYLESDFFDTDYFGRYYIPLSFNTEQPYMAQASPYNYEWVNLSGETNSYARQVENISTSAVSSVNWFKTKDIVEENLGLNPLEYSEYSATTLSQNEIENYMFALPLSNGLPFSFKATITSEATATYGVFPYQYAGGTFQLWKYRQNTSPLLAELVLGTNFIVVLNMSGTVSTFTVTGTTTSAGSIYGTDLYFLSYQKTPGIPFIVKGATFEITSSPVVLPFTIELYKEMSCDQKQIDFIQNINRTFNLVVVEHPIKPKTLIVEPMIDYIGKGETLDWTDKVNYDATQNLYPTTNLINGTIFAANKADKDYINTEYTKRSNKIFGQNTIDLNIDYKNQTTDLTQTLGQNTDYYLNASGDTNIALPCYFITKEDNNNGISVFEYRPFRSIPRQTFKSVSIPTGNTESRPFFYRYAGTSNPFTVIGLTSMGTFLNYNRLTTYPFAIKDFSHYTIYDSSNNFTTDEIIYPTLENQYDRYYRDYIDDLTSDENKIYQVQMYLTPWEVANLYYNETIIIKNAKFRINKISGLSLLRPGLCNVELVKLTRDYTPSPILFYDLISCDDPCDVIHTHTDLIYPIWAFEGQYVALDSPDCYFDASINYNICPKYKVVRTEYNEAYTYETPYFQVYRTQTSSYYTYWDYAVYNSCDDTTPVFKLEPFKNEIISAFTGNCVSMTITNNDIIPQTFTFKYCDGVDGSWTLYPSSAITLCGLYESFNTTGLTYCLSAFSACTSWTPLPTPTPSNTPNLSPSATRTPTPTPTQTSTPNQPTPTPTPTPTSVLCGINATINITSPGWVRYNLCNGTLTWEYFGSLGSNTITTCIQNGTIQPGFPYGDLAVFTVITSGTPC
jgi:hypothetical protein